MAPREVLLTGMAPDVRNKTQYSFNSRPKSEPRQVCWAVEAFPFSLVPSLSARQILIAYSMKNRRGKSGSKRHDDACRNVTNLTSRISLAPMNFVPRHQSLVQTALFSRTALSKAFTDTPTAIYRRKGTYMYTCERVSEASRNYGSPLLLAIRL